MLVKEEFLGFGSCNLRFYIIFGKGNEIKNGVNYYVFLFMFMCINLMYLVNFIVFRIC